MRLIRVTSRYFVAGLEADDIVRRTAPILYKFKDWPVGKAITQFLINGWKVEYLQ